MWTKIRAVIAATAILALVAGTATAIRPNVSPTGNHGVLAGMHQTVKSGSMLDSHMHRTGEEYIAK